MQMNGGKLVMQPETDVGSRLPLTSFSVIYPGLTAVKVETFLIIDYPDVREIETE